MEKNCCCAGNQTKSINRTALYENHVKLGAKMVDFAGWEMPIQYSSIPDEHIAVRTAAGVFDISHMGQILISGETAANFLNFLLTNNVLKLGIGDAQYSLMCTQSGGVIDDLYVYKIGETDYMLVVNASRKDVDLSHINDIGKKFNNVSVEPRFSNSAIAIQGPHSQTIMDSIVKDAIISGKKATKPSELLKNQLIVLKNADGKSEYIISRTGYTGEDGFEVFGPSNIVVNIWEQVLQEGSKYGIKPAGLGARDSLRLEACYPLYSHELSEEITPIEAGLKFFVDFEKSDFIGRKALLKQIKEGVQKRCIAFKMIESAPPPRSGYKIVISENPAVGWVSSGAFSPMLKNGIGMGFVPSQSAEVGRQIQIEIRGKLYRAEIVKKPFYKRS
ncbi:MAG: glycine cleavage system aminomethyltransferase GcvT [Verrucomicrobiae bacterium]|nr:glycine cleavage system aminomethyltransferase GcvT [Verrucomicrobiae bacterium]